MIAGRLATLQPDRLTSVIYIASLPLRGDTTVHGQLCGGVREGS